LDGILTLPRKKEFFSLVLRRLNRSTEKASALTQDMRQELPAATATIKAGTLRLDIRTDG